MEVERPTRKHKCNKQVAVRLSPKSPVRGNGGGGWGGCPGRSTYGVLVPRVPLPGPPEPCEPTCAWQILMITFLRLICTGQVCNAQELAMSILSLHPMPPYVHVPHIIPLRSYCDDHAVPHLVLAHLVQRLIDPLDRQHLHHWPDVVAPSKIHHSPNVLQAACVSPHDGLHPV